MTKRDGTRCVKCDYIYKYRVEQRFCFSLIGITNKRQ